MFLEYIQMGETARNSETTIPMFRAAAQEGRVMSFTVGREWSRKVGISRPAIILNVVVFATAARPEYRKEFRRVRRGGPDSERRAFSPNDLLRRASSRCGCTSPPGYSLSQCFHPFLRLLLQPRSQSMAIRGNIQVAHSIAARRSAGKIICLCGPESG